MPTVRNGFTLIELMIAVSIMAILGVVSFISVGTFRQDQDLQTTAENLQGFIRVAQSNATANIICGDSSGANWYIEFQDADTVNLKCSTDPSKDVATLPVLKKFDHKSNITTSAITTSPNCFPTRIKFAPLYGLVSFETDSINCFSSSISNLLITLINTSTKAQKGVNIDKGGSVNVQDVQ